MTMGRGGEITLLVLGTASLTVAAVFILENGMPNWRNLLFLSSLVGGPFCITRGLHLVFDRSRRPSYRRLHRWR